MARAGHTVPGGRVAGGRRRALTSPVEAGVGPLQRRRGPQALARDRLGAVHAPLHAHRDEGRRQRAGRRARPASPRRRARPATTRPPLTVGTGVADADGPAAASRRRVPAGAAPAPAAPARRSPCRRARCALPHPRLAARRRRTPAASAPGGQQRGRHRPRPPGRAVRSMRSVCSCQCLVSAGHPLDGPAAAHGFTHPRVLPQPRPSADSGKAAAGKATRERCVT